MCKNDLHVCTYTTLRFTFWFVNLFVEVSRVCAVLYFLHPRTQLNEIIIEFVLSFLYRAFEFSEDVSQILVVS